ncbi:MAG: phosphatase PAP2 family protein [Hyphomonadaceae bacterium]
MLVDLDRTLLLFVNEAAPHTALGKLIYFAGTVDIVRGFPIFIALVWLWLEGQNDRRARMLAGLAAACAAVIASVWIQHIVFVHVRPFLDPTLGIAMPSWEAADRWDHLNSFPSDTATLFFALATVVAVERPRWGLVAFAWALVTTGLERVAFGYHYPSDIVAAAVLGPCAVCGFARSPWITGLSARITAMFHGRQSALNALFFIVMAEAYTEFSSLEKALRAVLMVHALTPTS